MSNIGSRGLISCSIKCLRNVKIYSNKDFGVFQRSSSYNISPIKHKTTEIYKSLNSFRSFSTVKGELSFVVFIGL